MNWRQLRDVENHRRRLQVEVERLEQDYAKLAGGSGQSVRDEFELTSADWKELSATGRVKYRMPCMLEHEGSWPSQQALDDLGLGPDDAEILSAALRRSRERIWSTVRPLCLEVVKEESLVDLLGAGTCRRIVERAFSKADAAAAFRARQLVGEVHAGLQPLPEPGLPAHPIFVMLMAATLEGRQFEEDLSETFGPEEAARIWKNMPCAETVR
jgi:hypothetical protein